MVVMIRKKAVQPLWYSWDAPISEQGWQVIGGRLKLECEKLASEKTEMQRHYVMYYEMSYGLNVEMHKQPSKRVRTVTSCLLLLLTSRSARYSRWTPIVIPYPARVRDFYSG
uniref:Groucho/TLE N-terminal Q-rich domain-containing protein n=1 Tax=Timema monikensis TaxID=170555 RepID=A0A7R9EBP4_9NEOP|nr:unnamed protein product [Timema monikensis]